MKDSVVALEVCDDTMLFASARGAADFLMNRAMRHGYSVLTDVGTPAATTDVIIGVLDSQRSVFIYDHGEMIGHACWVMVRP